MQSCWLLLETKPKWQSSQSCFYDPNVHLEMVVHENAKINMQVESTSYDQADQ